MLVVFLFTAITVHADTALVSNLEKAGKMFQQGLLSREEFSTVKQRLLAEPSVVNAPLRTFGTGKSAFTLTTEELTIFEHSVVNSTGVMTHFWITGFQAIPGQRFRGFNGSGTDSATVRYYIDGEKTASIAFNPPMAAGVGFDDNTTNWGNGKIGRAGLGGWYINLKIPFSSSVRVTIQGSPSVSVMHTQAFVILRGCENLPVTVGPTTLPANARLRLHKIENTVFTPLSWVPLVDIPTGNGLIYLVALAAQSASYQFWEGCVHLHTPHQQPFPGTVLSTGTEDYFDSAFGFDAGLYHYPTAGCTHRKGGLPAGLPHTGSGFTDGTALEVSAYRFHEEDPLAFSGGVRLLWRIGDYINWNRTESPKCYIDVPSRPGDASVGGVKNTTVTSYAWVYSW